MNRTCKCCGATLGAGPVVKFVDIVDSLPHSRHHLYKLKRADRDGSGIEWLCLQDTDDGKRLMLQVELAARWYERKWPLVAERLRQLAPESQSKPTGVDAITTEGSDW